MKVLEFIDGNARALKEEDEAIKGVSENDGTVIANARFRILNVNKGAQATLSPCH